MGLLTTRTTGRYAARYVALQTHGQPVSVEFVTDLSLPPGVVAITEVASRFAGSRFTIALVGPRLLVTGLVPRRNIIAKNTGDITIEGGGNAVTGVSVREEPPLDLRDLDYQLYNAGRPLILQSMGGRARLTFAVGQTGTNYAVI